MGGTDIAERFPDQFSCWQFAGHRDFSQAVPDTLIRFPLRSKTHLEGRTVCTVSLSEASLALVRVSKLLVRLSNRSIQADLKARLETPNSVHGELFDGYLKFGHV